MLKFPFVCLLIAIAIQHGLATEDPFKEKVESMLEKSGMGAGSEQGTQNARVLKLYNEAIEMLVEAAGKGDAALVTRQLNMGVNPNAGVQEMGGMTALSAAAGRGHLEIVKMLVEHDAKVDLASSRNMTALMTAVRESRHEVVKYLLSEGANCNFKSPEEGVTPMHLVAVTDSLSMFRILQDAGAKTSERMTDGTRPIHLAAEYKQPAMVKAFLDAGDDIDVLTDAKWTPLHRALLQQSMDVIEYLVERGANLRAITEDGFSPLLIALSHNNSISARYLLKQDVDVNQESSHAQVALHLAADKNMTKIAETLLKLGAKVDARDDNRWTPLHFAASVGAHEIVKLLVDHDADIDAKTRDRLTPLHVSSSNNHTETVKVLLESGADPKLLDVHARDPLKYAARSGNTEITNLLIDNGANPNQMDMDNHTAILMAVLMDHVDTVESLFKKGSHLVMKRTNWTALHMAAFGGSLNSAKAVLKLDPSLINTRDQEGSTPLMAAVSQNNPGLVDFLIKNGADPNLPNKEFVYPLHIAAASNFVSITRKLLKKEASMAAIDWGSNTPLHYAAASGAMETAALLLESGSDIEFYSQDWWTALFHAANDTKMFEFLVSKGANISHADKGGSNLLHLASWLGNLELVQKLVEEYKFDVNAVSQRDESVLFSAAVRGRIEVAKYLVSKGAELDKKDTEGHTPAVVAHDGGYKETEEFLLSAGADPKEIEEFDRAKRLKKMAAEKMATGKGNEGDETADLKDETVDL